MLTSPEAVSDASVASVQVADDMVDGTSAIAASNIGTVTVNTETAPAVTPEVPPEPLPETATMPPAVASPSCDGGNDGDDGEGGVDEEGEPYLGPDLEDLLGMGNLGNTGETDNANDDDGEYSSDCAQNALVAASRGGDDDGVNPLDLVGRTIINFCVRLQGPEPLQKLTNTVGEARRDSIP